MADEGGVWRTIHGRRVFIKDGQSLTDAMKESGKFEESKAKTKSTGNDFSDPRYKQLEEMRNVDGKGKEYNTIDDEMYEEFMEELSEKLSDEELDALNSYFATGHEYLNSHLREGKEMNDYWGPQQKYLDEALKKVENYTQNGGELTRFVNIDSADTENFMKSHIQGTTIEFKEYLSTTAHTDTDYLNYMQKQYGYVKGEKTYITYKISSSSGGKDVTRLTDSEREVLFPRNSKFDILDIEQKGNEINIYMKESRK